MIAKRMLLSLLPNGDWRNEDIEFYIGCAPASIDPAVAKKGVANGLITALAGTMYEQYPRHRWVGADIAVDRCGLLCLVHSLGRGAYMRYMRQFGTKGLATDNVGDAPSGLSECEPLPTLTDSAVDGPESVLVALNEAQPQLGFDGECNRAAFNDASR